MTASDRRDPSPAPADRQPRRGPLRGVRVVEIGGIGPGPFAGMMLADMGADVVRVDRPDEVGRTADRHELLHRGRRSIAIDLKRPEGVEVLLRLAESAEVLFEGFRPGVVERLGIGPDECRRRNPRLVYGRMTGWGQDGPYAQVAGHDINYVAITGALGAIGSDKPVPPLNLVGDFGGGAMYLVYGIVCALLEARASGEGQVVDAAMVDGAASLTTFFHGLLNAGGWRDERAQNFLDGGAWFYDTYETADGRWVSVGAIEAEFRRILVTGLGLADQPWPRQWDQSTWPQMKERLKPIFAAKTLAEWSAVFEGTDACFAPVLSLREAPLHPHNVAREVFVDVDGVRQPGPAPRLSRTPGAISTGPSLPGEHTADILADWLGADRDEARGLDRAGAVRDLEGIVHAD